MPWRSLVTPKQPDLRRNLSQIGERHQIARVARSDTKLNQESVLTGMSRYRSGVNRSKIQSLPRKACQRFNQRAGNIPQ